MNTDTGRHQRHTRGATHTGTENLESFSHAYKHKDMTMPAVGGAGVQSALQRAPASPSSAHLSSPPAMTLLLHAYMLSATASLVNHLSQPSQPSSPARPPRRRSGGRRYPSVRISKLGRAATLCCAGVCQAAAGLLAWGHPNRNQPEFGI